MSDSSSFGFAKLVPGFDFLQNLAKGAAPGMAQMPNLSSWVAPTLNVEELEKRIGELKAVHFWLDQNSKALGATIQALEVQKMTLATLQGMNFNLGELAEALKVKPAQATGTEPRKETPAAARTAGSADTAREKAGEAPRTGKAAKKAGNGSASGPVDPLQWWGALTQQFQQIAADAMKDVAHKTAAEAARSMERGAEREGTQARRSATRPARTASGASTGAPAPEPAAEPPAKQAARKPPARKARPRS